MTNEICSVCKVKVTTKDDKAEVYVLNDKGNWIVCCHYEGGKKVSEDTKEYKYAADGNVEEVTMKTNGELVYEGANVAVYPANLAHYKAEEIKNGAA